MLNIEITERMDEEMLFYLDFLITIWNWLAFKLSEGKETSNLPRRDMAAKLDIRD